MRYLTFLFLLLSAQQVAGSDSISADETWEGGLLVERRTHAKEIDAPREANDPEKSATSLCVGGAVESIDKALGIITCQLGEGTGQVRYEVPWLIESGTPKASEAVQQQAASECPKGMALDRINEFGELHCIAL